jgi:predicted transcriptional regulator
MKDPRVQSERDRRLAEALRRNLRLRKAQAKSRRAGEADARNGLRSDDDGNDAVDASVFKETESPDDSGA